MLEPVERRLWAYGKHVLKQAPGRDLQREEPRLDQVLLHHLQPYGGSTLD